jgi:hypothetical protein
MVIDPKFVTPKLCNRPSEYPGTRNTVLLYGLPHIQGPFHKSYSSEFFLPAHN